MNDTAIQQSLIQLISRFDAVNQDQHRQTRDLIIEKLGDCTVKAPRDTEVVESFGTLGLSSDEEAVRFKTNNIILQSLSYPNMSNRYEDIVEAFPDTFGWVFRDATTEHLPWDNFAQWLKTGTGVYWISGKAGSGKSTLMKHVLDDTRTRQYLEDWTADLKLCSASFFFWNSGSPEQKSYVGFLKAVLFQLLEQYPDLISVVLPERWAPTYSYVLDPENLQSPNPSWALGGLKRTLRAIIQQRRLPIKIFMSIDGLDEFDGDQEEIVELLQGFDLDSHVKVCVLMLSF